MRVLRDIPLSQIDVDRMPLNPSTLALVKYLEVGGEVPPVHVAPTGSGRFKILDGRHRYVAHKLLGRPLISAKFGVRI